MNRSLLAHVRSHDRVTRLVVPVLVPLVMREVRSSLDAVLLARVVRLLGGPVEVVRLGAIGPDPIRTDLVHSDPCQVLRVSFFDSARGQV